MAKTKDTPVVDDTADPAEDDDPKVRPGHIGTHEDGAADEVVDDAVVEVVEAPYPPLPIHPQSTGEHSASRVVWEN